ncbi:hypothetical protein PROFUN_16206 [Planoprotostelium fungivorum]|uniref:Uncharacterized protein n=1 Tax=Planoprotostelium fungivorum TaxID=1890364 RepID=A0A2P6MRR2_9EUKA|nr:hypothetical protein PROFUN_16206 [Planoprotostelium fungivorum]
MKQDLANPASPDALAERIWRQETTVLSEEFCRTRRWPFGGNEEVYRGNCCMTVSSGCFKLQLHSLPNGTRTSDNKYVAGNGDWKATGPGYSVSHNYKGPMPNGSTVSKFLKNN